MTTFRGFHPNADGLARARENEVCSWFHNSAKFLPHLHFSNHTLRAQLHIFKRVAFEMTKRKVIAVPSQKGARVKNLDFS